MRPDDPGSITSVPCSTQWPALLLPLRLEVRRIDDQLCVRVLPDQPFINSHKESLTTEEAAAGENLRAIVSLTDWQTNADSLTKARDEWAELARRFGPPRAAWILNVLMNAGSAPITTDDAAAIPMLFLLPERFVFMVYEQGELVYHENGVDIDPTGLLTLLPQPTDDDSPPTDGLFDNASRWISDFQAAVDAGLGHRIDLIPDHVAQTELQFSEIVVVGLSALGECAGAQKLEELVNIHRFTDGCEFLAYGTPTNNTRQTPSGHSESRDELIESFEVEVDAPPVGADCAADDVARALGLSSADVFRHIEGATLTPSLPFRPLVDALWPCTGDYFFSQILGYEQFAEQRTMLQRFVRRHVRPGGHFPMLRVGNLPFGILPATRISSASSNDSTGWKAEPNVDYRLEDIGYVWSRFDAALSKPLEVLLKLWFERTQNHAFVPRAGANADPDDELVRLLGMAPHSIEFRSRPIVDQTFIGVLYMLFQYTHFGINSSFEGVTDAPTAAAAWGYTWQQTLEQRRAFYESLGIAPFLRCGPPLLRLFAWGPGARLDMDLVRVTPPPIVEGANAPPTEPPPPPDGPETYLGLFDPQQPASLPPRGASNTILFDLLRRSIALEPQLPVALRKVWDALQNLRDYPVLEFFNRTGTPESLAALAAREPQISDYSAALDALAIGRATPFDTVQALGASIQTPDSLFPEIIKRLHFDFSPRLENGVRDLLDLQTYRLDAWYTALAARRLFAMRSDPAEAQGLHWGAYGYLEDIKLKKHVLTIVERDAGSGYIHAPTIAQASAAALLRSAYAVHRNDGADNAYAVNLTSRRVNRALNVIDGIQQGQDLSALLGYQFERALHDEGLDRVIDEFRVAFPFSPPDEQDTADAAESIGARDVCDGRALVTADPDADTRVQSALTSLSAGDRDQVKAILRDIRDMNDAVGDLLLYEGVFQGVRGNVERCGAALDACAGLGRPPEIESVTTPNSGPTLRHRVCLFFPWLDNSTTSGARAAAEPSLNEWVGGLLGPLGEISCRAYYVAADTHADSDYLNIGVLSPTISTLDFLYMCTTLPGGQGETEIEARLRRQLRNQQAVAPDTLIRLALNEPEPGKKSVQHAMELARAILEVFGNVAVATPATLTHPDDAPTTVVYSTAVVDKVMQRARDARDVLAGQIVGLMSSNPVEVVTALDVCAGYGMPEAVLDRVDDPSIPERSRRCQAIVNKRVAGAGPFILGAAGRTQEAEIQDAVNALKVLFGEGFVVVPGSDASPLDADLRFDFDDMVHPPRPDEDRVWLWLQQVAETHPRVRHFETLLMLAEAWGPTGQSAPSLTMAQLPRVPDLEWQALADCEMTFKERARRVQCVVAIKPKPLDITRVTGFVLDEWTETMPRATVTTGVSFEYNQPGSQAPQCFLLAVPGNFDDPAWSADHLAGIVRDTMTLAKVRLVDLDALPDLAGLAPPLLLPLPDAPVHYYSGKSYADNCNAYHYYLRAAP